MRVRNILLDLMGMDHFGRHRLVNPNAKKMRMNIKRDKPHAPGTMKVDRYSRRPYRCGDATWTNKLSLLLTTMLNTQHFSELCEKRRSCAFIIFPKRRKDPSAKVMGRTVPETD